MMITECINHHLQQLMASLHLLSDEQYAKPLNVLSQASIGQHVRHIIEFISCLDEGYDKGEINYDKRNRDKAIENTRLLAVKWLQCIVNGLQKENKELTLYINCSTASDSFLQIPSNYYRELLYNLEHIIHHMAIIRIGIAETTAIELPEEFGIAPTTLKHRRACAQ